MLVLCFFFFQAEDGIRDHCVTGVQTCALPIFTELQLLATASDGHVSLSWSSVSGAMSYQVNRSTGTDAAILIATTTATSLTDVGGAAGTAYAYSIVPVTTAGPDATQSQTANATWAAATSVPAVLQTPPG